VVLKDGPADAVLSTPSAEALLCLVWKLGGEVWGGEQTRWGAEEEI